MRKYHNKLATTLGMFLIALSGIISLSSCLSFIGEPDVPESMLK